MTVGGEMATLMWHSPTLEYFEKRGKDERNWKNQIFSR